MQREAEIAPLDFFHRAHTSSHQQPELPPEVPSSWDTRYDPDDPRADYAGLVSKDEIYERRHVQDSHVAVRQNITSNEEGMTGVEGAEMPQFSKINKIPPRKAPEDNFNILGGIGHDDQARWRTTQVRQAAGEPTSYEQLTIERRMGAKKQTPDPCQSTVAIPNPFDPLPTRAPASNRPTRTPEVSVAPNSNLLEGIGGSLLGKITPLQSAISRENSELLKSKLLVQENYHRNMPGYSGARK